jgi:hypothetical protein
MNKKDYLFARIMIPLSAIARVFNLPSTRSASTSTILNKSRSSIIGCNNDNDNDNDDQTNFYYQMDQIDYPEMIKVSGRYKIITNTKEKAKRKISQPSKPSQSTAKPMITYDEHYYLTFTM